MISPLAFVRRRVLSYVIDQRDEPLQHLSVQGPELRTQVHARAVSSVDHALLERGLDERGAVLRPNAVYDPTTGGGAGASSSRPYSL